MITETMLVRFALQDLQDRYASALDGNRLEEWPDFFVEECLYEIVPKENEDLGFPAPIMHCVGKAMLRDRVISLRNANIFAPQNYRHFSSALCWHHETEGVISASSNYLVINSSQLGDSVVYQAGTYRDRVIIEGEAYRFLERRVICDTTRVQTLLALPI